MKINTLLLFGALAICLPASMSALSFTNEGQTADEQADQAAIDKNKAHNKASTKKEQGKLNAKKKKNAAQKNATAKSKHNKEKAKKKRDSEQDAAADKKAKRNY